MKTFGKIALLAFITFVSACTSEDIGPGTGPPLSRHLYEPPEKYTPDPNTPWRPLYVDELAYERETFTPVTRKRKKAS